ncbi:MAG: tyrosine-type recombinase/integrase [Planctomycetia bacterium]|nr:tyrosine-type recombinase/integrase [Planctomycetia bacterium]
MPRKPSRPPVVCQNFTWRLLERDGVYYADGRTGKLNLGKHSLGTRDPDQALINLRNLDQQKAVELGLVAPTSQQPASFLSIPDGWKLYLAHCQRAAVLGGVSAGTLKRYQAVQNKHLAFCNKNGIRSWAEVNKTNTEKYGNHLADQEYADRSIYLELTLIKSVTLWLIKEKHLPADSRFDLSLVKPQGTDTYCYTLAEVGTMIDHCRLTPALTWLAGVIVALACTGLRIGELASLRWSDVDFRSNTILLTDERASNRRKKLGQVRTTKGKRNRSLPIHPDLLAIFLDLKATGKESDGRVFHGPRSGKLKPDTVRNILLREVIESLKDRFPTPPGEIGFEHGRVHSFRHYFCSQAFLGGAAEADIKDWLGHRDSRMVTHYRHLRRDDSQRKMQQIDFLSQNDRKVQSSG